LIENDFDGNHETQLAEDVHEHAGDKQVRLLQAVRLPPRSVLTLWACFLLHQGVPEDGLEARTQGRVSQKHW